MNMTPRKSIEKWMFKKLYNYELYNLIKYNSKFIFFYPHYVNFLKIFLNKNNANGILLEHIDTFDDIISVCEDYINMMSCDDFMILIRMLLKIKPTFFPFLQTIKMVILYVLKKLGYNGLLHIIYADTAREDKITVNCKINALNTNIENYMHFTRLDEKTLRMIYNFVGEKELNTKENINMRIYRREKMFYYAMEVVKNKENTEAVKQFNKYFNRWGMIVNEYINMLNLVITDFQF